MNNRYKHLLYHLHHVSVKHPPMSNTERAAQFGAFQALSGYEEGIKETARTVDEQLKLTEEQQDNLNQVFQQLAELNRPLITVTYFVSDMRKAGGTYVRCTGHFRFLDMQENKLKFVEGMAILLPDICQVELLPDA